MADLRTMAAAVLGVGLGLLLIAYPEAVIQVQTVGRVPRDRSGEYGQDTPTDDQWRRLVRIVGAGILVAGIYFGLTAFALV